MSAMDKLREQQQQQEQQQKFESLASQMQTQQGTLNQLVESQNSLVQVVENLTRQLTDIKAASQTSRDSVVTLPEQFVNDMKQMNENSANVLNVISDFSTNNKQLTLPDGQNVKSSDVQALSIANKTASQMQGLSSKVDTLAAEVARKSQVRLSDEKVADYLGKRFDKAASESIAKAVNVQVSQQMKQVTKTLADTQRQQATELKRATNLQEQANTDLNRVASRLETLNAGSVWRGVGQIALALLPLLTLGILVTGVANIIGSVLGLGAVFPWAWSAWVGIETWWVKLLWLVPIAGAIYGLWVGIQRLEEFFRYKYRGW